MKIGIVTGASSGMGREAVLQLAGQFAFDEIWVIARRKERLLGLSRQVKTPLRLFPLDLQQEEDLTLLENALRERAPEVKFLVNAAGYGKIGPVGSLEREEETGMVRLNCQALCALTHMVLPYMPHNSRILMFASAAAFAPQPDFAVYAATKAFVLSYSQALGAELASRDIAVTAVCPGPVKTEFFDIAQSTGEIPIYKLLVMANPRRVVAKAIRDSIAKKPVSVYGLSMKAFWLLSRIVPHRVIFWVMQKF